MVAALRRDDFEKTADEQQQAFEASLPPPPPPTPVPTPAQPKPTFSLPAWSDIAFGATQAAESVTGAVQQATAAVQEAAGSFKMPAWEDFKLGGPSNQEQIAQNQGAAGAANLPEWSTIKFPDTEGTVGPGLSSPGQTAGVRGPSASAPAVGEDPASILGLSSPSIDVSQGRDAVLQSWAPALRSIEAGGGPSARNLAAVILAENGAGQAGQLAPVNNNWFSISHVPERQFQAGAGVGGRFANYASPLHSAADFVDLISKSPRYADAWALRNAPTEQFMGALAKAGYIVPEPGFPVEDWLRNTSAGAETFDKVAGSVEPQVEGRGNRYAVQTAQQNPYDIAFDYDQPYGDAQFNPAIPRHRGVDLVVRGAENNGRGSPVAAFQGGTVAALTQDPNGGNGVILQDANGLYHRYFHLDSVSVKQGQQLAPGATIGTLGASGTEGFPHVHFEVSKGLNGDPVGQTIDPRPYMAGGAPAHDDHEQHDEVIPMASGDEVPPTRATQFGEFPDKGASLLVRPMQAYEPNLAGDSERGPFDPPGYSEDSTYGPFDPPGYRAEPEPEPERNIFERAGQGIGDLSRNLTGALHQTAADIGNQFAPRTEPTAPSFETDEPAAGKVQPVIAEASRRYDVQGQETGRTDVWNNYLNTLGIIQNDNVRRAAQAFADAQERGEPTESLFDRLKMAVQSGVMQDSAGRTLGAAEQLAVKLMADSEDATAQAADAVLQAFGIDRESRVSVPNPLGTGQVAGVNVPGLRGVGEFFGVDPNARVGLADVVVHGANRLNPLHAVSLGGQFVQHPTETAGLVAGAHFGPKAIGAAGRAIGNLPPVRRAGEFLGELRDTATAMTRGLPGGAPVGIVGESDRYYHGTGRGFDTPDPTTFDENGLFGPGYYLTSDPRVAGSYADVRTPQPVTDIDTLRQQLKAYEDEGLEGAADDVREEIARLLAEQRSGPNVRAVDIPRGLRLLDAEAAREPSEWADILRGARSEDGYAAGAHIEYGHDRPILYDDVADALAAGLDRPSQAKQLLNDGLQAAGYDGISYSGGKRIPMMDADSKPIEHNVTMIFGDSLPRITNATSGQPGGLLPSAAPAAQRLAGQAAGGAVSGGYAASQEEGADLGSVARGAALGAAGSVARGALGRQGSGQVLRSAIRAADLSDPDNRAMGEMFEKPVQGPKDTTSWAIKLAQVATDDRAALYAWQKDLQQRQPQGSGPTELIGDLTRVNPDSTAAQRLEGLRETTETLRKEGVDPDVLGIFLARVHDVDIANDFGQRAYDRIIQKGGSAADAQVAYDRVADRRTFSGGRHRPDIVASLQSLAQDLSPEQRQALMDAAQKVWKLNQETLERKYLAGGLSQADYQDLVQRYPHYVTTDIVDHIDPDSAVPAAGRSISQREKPLNRLSASGTAADRLDPLRSVVANTIRSERWIARNAPARLFADLAQSDPQSAAQLGVNPSKLEGTKEVVWYENGERKTIRMSHALAEVIEMSHGAGGSGGLGVLGGIFSKLTGPYKAMLTTLNAGFQFVTNPLRDGPDAIIGMAGARGGPQHIPRVMKAYGEAVADVLQNGKFTQAYKLAGGSYERLDTSAKGIERYTKELTASKGELLKDPRQIAKIARDVLTLGAVPAGGKIEMFPRVAASKLALQEGKTPTQAMIAGHDVTVPFEVAGTWARGLNTAIPFLNATIQNSARFAREMRAHPIGTGAAAATMMGVPALAAYAINHQNPETESAYDDVPQYLKDSGTVFMLPWAGKDNRGPLPNYLWLPGGRYQPFKVAMDEAVTKAMGDNPNQRELWQTLGSVLTAYSPVKGESLGAAMSSVVPPGISTGIELGLNKDFFRGRTIATDESDRRAGNLAKGISRALNAVGGSGMPLTGGLRDVRPSQTEYIIRDLFGAPGQTASAAVDLATGRDDDRTRPIQDVPVLGGLAGRVVRDTGGQKLQAAREARIPPAVDEALREAGLRPDEVVQPVGVNAQGVPLSREQQLAYQTFMTGYLGREIATARRSAEYRDPATREQAIRDAVSAARTAAAERVLSRIPSSQQEMLKRQEVVRKAG